MSQEPKEDFEFGRGPQHQPHPGSEPTAEDSGRKAAGIDAATMPDHDEPDEDTAYGLRPLRRRAARSADVQ